jgi:DNA invertase Pin-like site-specific DNA recombinase
VENIPQPETSGNTPTYDYKHLSKHQKTPPVDKGAGPDFDAGYRLLEPDETDPNPRTLPPDLRDGMQAALHAQLRGFDVLPLRPDGTQVAPDNAPTNDPAIIRERWAGTPRCKVGGVTNGLVVLVLDGSDQYRPLAAITNTAAIASHIHKRIFLFFRLPAGVRSVEGGLAAGVDVISDDGYVALPSGSITDGCRWVNRYTIATAPQWLVDKLAALAASQSQTEVNSVMGAGATAVDRAALPGSHRRPTDREHIEVESGRRNDRPELAKALAVCRKRRGARLVIAKLDRLSRNVAFIATMMDSNVEFVACDNPHATRLTLHILAAVAEHEREMISIRTKAALAAAKARGKALGRYGAETLAPAHKAAAQARAEELRPILAELASQSTRAIAAELTARGIPTPRGGRWQAQSVANMLRHLAMAAAA